MKVSTCNLNYFYWNFICFKETFFLFDSLRDSHDKIHKITSRINSTTKKKYMSLTEQDFFQENQIILKRDEF